MAHTVSLGLILMVLWLLLSGRPEGLLIGLGLASTVLVVMVARRMGMVDHEGHPIHLTPGTLKYWPWLAWEIIKANIAVAKVIIQKDMPIEPTCLCIKGTQKNELGHVVYANSITLTPGTVTTQLEGSLLTIHALTIDAAESLAAGQMDRRVTEMELGISKDRAKGDRT